MGHSSHCLKGRKNPKDVYRVRKISHTESRPRQEVARRILEEVARQVHPLMIKHKWSVNLLTETHDKRVLGLNNNEGEIVQLRLRNMYKEDEFLPFAIILDTMLHELCHNAYGDHDSQFDQLLDLLRKEYEELVITGIIKASSKEFDLRGRNLAILDIVCENESELYWLPLKDQACYAVNNLASALSDLGSLMVAMMLEPDTRAGVSDDLIRANHFQNRFHECRAQKRALRYSTTTRNFQRSKFSRKGR